MVFLSRGLSPFSVPLPSSPPSLEVWWEASSSAENTETIILARIICKSLVPLHPHILYDTWNQH